MIRKTMVLGTLLAGLTAAPAMAQQNYIGNVVGGGVARMVGGGQDAQVVFEVPAGAPQTHLATAPVGAPRS